jgi:hypothetical protein
MNECTAARRMLRVRALLPRSCSRCSRNAPIVGASSGVSSRRAGGVRVFCCMKLKSSRKASR